MARKSRTGNGEAGFTLLELLVVLFIVALIAAIAAPNVTAAITRAREAALAENLAVMRRALDDYYSDAEAWPDDLDDLVDKGYLRAIPDDPVSDKGADWALVLSDGGGIMDLNSASGEAGLNGIPYSEW